MHSTFFHTLLSCGRSFNYRFFFTVKGWKEKFTISFLPFKVMLRGWYWPFVSSFLFIYFHFLFAVPFMFFGKNIYIYIYMLSHRRSQFWGSRVWAQWAWQVSIRNLSLAIIIDAVLTLLKWSMIFIKMYKRKKNQIWMKNLVYYVFK